MRKKKEMVNEKNVKTQKHIFTNVDDIVIPELMFHPIKFSEPLLNNILSEMGGIVPSQVIMMTGVAGGGKTTLCSKLGACVESKFDPIFVSLEMSDFQLKLQANKIDGFNRFKILREVHDIDGLLEDLKVQKPSFVIVDSIQKLANQFGGKDAHQIMIVSKFTEFAKDTFIPVILIGHCNKDGNYKGPSSLLHEIDTHIHLFLEKGTGDRYFVSQKNRFGGDASSVAWKILNDKVVIGNHYEQMEIVTQEDLIEAIEIFKGKSKGKRTGDYQDIKPVIPMMLNFLSNKYSDYMKSNTVAKNNRIKITHEPRGKTCDCLASKAIINFTPLYFNVLTDGMTSVYKKEHKFEITWTNKKKEDMMLYTVIHEFSHLFDGMQNHTIPFFELVERFCIENSFIFENAAEKVKEAKKLREINRTIESEHDLLNIDSPFVNQEGDLILN